ncbi:MAG TPA: hypothetical protein VM915_02565, partial [Verrucomicrobiae bacterium]|nr:hypothetical protein [Verrucomicrobiae bacterium]
MGLGTIAAFTRLMSAEEFGQYALVLSISLAGHILAFTWAEAAAFRFLQSARAQGHAADHFATLIAIASAICLCVVALTLLLLTFAGIENHAPDVVAFAVGAAMMRFVTRIGRETDRADLAFERYTLLETSYLLLGFSGGVAALVV